MTEHQIRILQDVRDTFECCGDTGGVQAIDAALTLAGQTCGNCRKWWYGTGASVGYCANFREGRKASDGCRLGWEAK